MDDQSGATGAAGGAVMAGVVPMSLEVLEQELCRWSANMTAAEARWLHLVAEWDRRRGWDVSGCSSCAHWLSSQTSLDLRTAYEKVRVARALVQFPSLAAAMSNGSLSYAKARAITRVVNDVNADAFLELALASTSNQPERIVAGYLRYEPEADSAEDRAHRDRRVTIRNEDAVGVITIRVPVEAAAVLIGCMERFIDHTDLADGLAARRADAVLMMAAHAVAALDFADDAVIDDPYLATVHLTPDVFEELAGSGAEPAGRGGVCCVAPGAGLGVDPVSVPRKSARRILCDCMMQGFRQDDRVSDAARVGAGRRTVSRRLKRALRLRDHGCRFPGCPNAVWVDAHHIVHWLDHGPTVEENLVCLCRRHHRLMHEGGWTITGEANNDLWFHRPDGTTVAAQPLRTLGAEGPVEALGLASEQGKCGWWGDPLDLEYTLDVIIGNEYGELRPSFRQRKPLIRG